MREWVELKEMIDRDVSAKIFGGRNKICMAPESDGAIRCRERIWEDAKQNTILFDKVKIVSEVARQQGLADLSVTQVIDLKEQVQYMFLRNITLRSSLDWYNDVLHLEQLRKDDLEPTRMKGASR